MIRRELEVKPLMVIGRFGFSYCPRLLFGLRMGRMSSGLYVGRILVIIVPGLTITYSYGRKRRITKFVVSWKSDGIPASKPFALLDDAVKFVLDNPSINPSEIRET